MARRVAEVTGARSRWPTGRFENLSLYSGWCPDLRAPRPASLLWSCSVRACTRGTQLEMAGQRPAAECSDRAGSSCCLQPAPPSSQRPGRSSDPLLDRRGRSLHRQPDLSVGTSDVLNQCTARDQTARKSNPLRSAPRA